MSVSQWGISIAGEFARDDDGEVWFFVDEQGDLDACSVCGTYLERELDEVVPRPDRVAAVARHVRLHHVATSGDGWVVVSERVARVIESMEPGAMRSLGDGVYTVDVRSAPRCEHVRTSDRKAKVCERCGQYSPIWLGRQFDSTDCVEIVLPQPMPALVCSQLYFSVGQYQHRHAYVSTRLARTLGLRMGAGYQVFTSDRALDQDRSATGPLS